MKQPVEQLLRAKMRMIESEKGRRIDEINEYIVSKLDYYKKLTGELPDDRKTEWEPLNQLFLAVLRH